MCRRSLSVPLGGSAFPAKVTDAQAGFLDLRILGSISKDGQNVAAGHHSNHAGGCPAFENRQAADVVIRHMVGGLPHAAIVIDKFREQTNDVANVLVMFSGRGKQIAPSHDSNQVPALVQDRVSLMRCSRFCRRDPLADRVEQRICLQNADRLGHDVANMDLIEGIRFVFSGSSNSASGNFLRHDGVAHDRTGHEKGGGTPSQER